MFTWVGVKLVSTAVGLEVLAEGWGRFLASRLWREGCPKLLSKSPDVGAKALNFPPLQEL